MSALLDQFVEEARTLIEGAGGALLRLERDPADARAINDLFRSVHTLKGTSALFEFPALTKLVHAGEDLLDGVREGTIPVCADLVDLQLELLDLLRTWVDALSAEGVLPADAAAASRELIARLAESKAPADGPAKAGPAAATTSACDWLDALGATERAEAQRAARADGLTVMAIEYLPDAGCFFRGDDPLMTCRNIPDAYALVIDTVGPPPAPADFDPYDCRLRFRALSTAPRAELEHLFRYVSDQITITELRLDELTPGDRSAPAAGAASQAARGAAPNNGSTAVAWSSDALRVVREQRTILTLPAADSAILAGRIASAGRTLANVARAHRAESAAHDIDTATSAALAADAAGVLLDALDIFGDDDHPTHPAPADHPAVNRVPAPNGDGPSHQIRTLKVDQSRVDRLMALIGELVVAKNALPFLARRAEHVHGSRELSREIGQRYSVIDRLAGEMQEAIMEVRLLPVSEVFARFPRLIRDIARKLDKQIELVVVGEDTRADKNIIELLGDPLIHIVRNAADHGIESPAARIAKGKPAHGTIRLTALQEGDRVVIEVSDDGGGVDTGRVIAKALERGIIDAETAERMSPAEAAALIFHPGLSTADHVSDLSGRGVGMDVVQTSIRDSGGTVSVSSQPGLGTTVRLALPLSMAVMRVMTIETAGALYGVPIDLIAETVRVDETAIRTIKQSETFLLRDTIVPLVRLRALLRLPMNREEREAVLVLRTPGGTVGMIVDRFDEHMDIILKPLEGILSGLKGFAGTALLGDGRVLMILDVKALV